MKWKRAKNSLCKHPNSIRYKIERYAKVDQILHRAIRGKYAQVKQEQGQLCQKNSWCEYNVDEKISLHQ